MMKFPTEWKSKIHGPNHQPDIYIHINPNKSQFSYGFPMECHQDVTSPRNPPVNQVTRQLRKAMKGGFRGALVS